MQIKGVVEMSTIPLKKKGKSRATGDAATKNLQPKKHLLKKQPKPSKENLM
jgi:hypothetical protein